MKREWDANNRKAKKALGTGASRSGRKRKSDDEVLDGMNQGGSNVGYGGVNFNLNINVSGSGPAEQKGKKSKLEPKTRKKKQTARRTVAPASSRVKESPVSAIPVYSPSPVPVSSFFSSSSCLS